MGEVSKKVPVGEKVKLVRTCHEKGLRICGETGMSMDVEGEKE